MVDKTQTNGAEIWAKLRQRVQGDAPSARRFDQHDTVDTPKELDMAGCDARLVEIAVQRTNLGYETAKATRITNDQARQERLTALRESMGKLLTEETQLLVRRRELERRG